MSVLRVIMERKGHKCDQQMLVQCAVLTEHLKVHSYDAMDKYATTTVLTAHKAGCSPHNLLCHGSAGSKAVRPSSSFSMSHVCLLLPGAVAANPQQPLLVEGHGSLDCCCWCHKASGMKTPAHHPDLHLPHLPVPHSHHQQGQMKID